MTNWKNAADGSWTDPTVWDTGTVPGPTDDVSISVAGNYRVSISADINAASLTVSDPNAVVVAVDPGGLDTISGNLTNAGALGVDSDSFTGEGRSSFTVGGTLTNTGTVVIGPPTNSLGANSTLTVGALAGPGGIALNGTGGTTPNRALLNVLSAAPVTQTGNLTLTDDALLLFASGQIGTIASGATVRLSTNLALIADFADPSTNSALSGLTENDGSLVVLNGDSVAIAGDLANAGALGVDSDSFTGEGGSSVTVAGTLTNTGTIVIGPPTNGLSANDTLTVGAVTGSGGVSIFGSGGTTPNQAELNVLSAAPATQTANLTLIDDALLQFASGQIGTIASGVTVKLSTNLARIADAASPSTNSALSGLTELDGTLLVLNGDSVAIAGDLTDKGALGVDSDSFTGEGGSSVTVAGTLTNSGTLVIGPPTNGLSANSTLTVGALAGAGGILLSGSGGATPNQAELNVLSAAPATQTANLTVTDDALLQFASGQIGTIDGGVTVILSTNLARIADAASPSTNSALSGLTENDGTFLVLNGDSVTTAGNLTNTGFLGVDSDSFTGEGGSSVTVAGTLTNSGTLVIGPPTNGLSANSILTAGALAGAGGILLSGSGGATPNQAELNVLSAAPATQTANLTLTDDALLQFASGQIGTIASGVTVHLSGALARIADAGAASTNSALSGLTENDGTFLVLNGDSVATAGNLTNTGFLGVDSDSFTSEGGSSITVAGTLTNTGNVVVGPPTDGLGANSTLTVGALAGTGGIGIHGSGGATPNQAELNVLSAAPATQTANLTLTDDALLQFASGQIGTIASGVTVHLSGALARIADAGATSTSSALSGLTENDGTFLVLNGDSVATAGNLTNTGFLGVDSDSFTAEGGSSITIAGTLTNTGNVVVGPPTDGLGANSTLTVGALAGTGGIGIHGSGGATPNQAELNVLSAAPATQTANLTLDGDGLLQFASGQIGTVASGVTVHLSGALARIADAGATSTSSALTGLTENDGALVLINGASVTVGGNLTNTGFLGLDSDSFTAEGGSSVTIAGTLTNNGLVVLGPATGGLGANVTLTAGAVVNHGTINLFSGGSTNAAVSAGETVTNEGTLNISANSLLQLAAGGVFTQAAGATVLTGTLAAATVIVSGGLLELNGGVVTAGTIEFSGIGGTLAFANNATVAAISGFVAGDTLDFVGLSATQITAAFLSATGLTTLAVTLSDSSVRDINLVGDYSGAAFAIGHSGTDSVITTGVPGGAAVAAFENLGGGGAIVPSAATNTFTLDLGTTTLGGPALSMSLGILNAALAPADLLDGTFSLSGPGVFSNSGFDPFTGVAAGNVDGAPRITVSPDTLGQFTETIVLHPVDHNPNGTLTAKPDLTLIVLSEVDPPPPIVPPPPKRPTGILWGDVHITTFDGLAYNFQAEGEFVIAKSTVPGDSFQVQTRLTPYAAGSSVSIMTMIGAQIGADRITFASGRVPPVWVNGTASSLSGTGTELQLSGGTLREASPGVFVLAWNSGESMTVDTNGVLDMSLSLAATDGPGSVAGLLGGDSGQANDFALANGTPLPQPINSTQLYGEFADAWRVTQATSLLDYGTGETTGTFTDTQFPFDAATLANLPSGVVQTAAKQTAATGITDPTIAQMAQFDFAATGDPAFLADGAFAQSVGDPTTAASIANTSSVVPAIGVGATLANLAETQGGPTNVSFSVYLTAPVTHDTVVDWSVTSPGAGFLAASAFGGTLPSGTATIVAGATSTNVTVTVPSSAFGTEPSDTLQMTVAATDGTAIFAPTAQTVLLNPNPEPGPPAGVAITDLSVGGTFAQTGTNYTLDLGTFQQGTGPVTARFGIVNTGTAGADQLIGTFDTSGPSAFTLTGFSTFGPIAPQNSDANPLVSLSTDTAGTFTETITLSPQDSNNTGFVAALPDQTLTITGTVANVPPAVISAPASVSTFVNMAAQFPGLSINDIAAPGQPLTVTVTATSGTVTTSMPGALSIQGYGTNKMTLAGNEAAINAALAALAFTAASPGPGTVTIAVTDAERAAASQVIAVNTTPVPLSGGIFVAPVDTLVVGRPSGFAGLQLIDPFDTAMGNTITLTVTSDILNLNVQGESGATVIGGGTGDVQIVGTVPQINALLADDLFGDLSVTASILTEFLISKIKGIFTYAAFSVAVGAPLDANGAGTINDDDLIPLAGPEAKSFLVGAAFASFALNSAAAAAVGANPPTNNELLRDIAVILADAHIVTPNGTIYDFNPAGEFILAGSNQSGDSFLVEARFEPLANRTSASVMTQVAAQVGTDRVTFGVGRAGVVWVNGAAVTLSQGAPDNLSGGELTQMSANTYEVVWNTGESITVTVDTDFLNVQIAPGPNNTASTLFGILNLSQTPGSEFQLPDGTVLPQPLSQADFSGFLQSWAVPQQFSLLDYGVGQTTATFTDTSFPTTPISLASLPADVLAKAAAAVAAAGITDPGVINAAEFDYIASGGDLRLVSADASLLAGFSTSEANITPAAAAPVSMGVLPTQPNVRATGTTVTPITFEAYLTGEAVTDTTVDFAVVAAGAGFLDASAFGGTLPTGSIVIPAGQTTGSITINVPANGLGSLAQANLDLQVSSPESVPVFAGTARVSITQPVAGAPGVPDIVSLVSLGTFTQNGTSYTLDLGDVQYGEPLPDLLFGITNAATGAADELSGTVSAPAVDGFVVNGASLPAPLQAGQSYNGIDVAVQYKKLGENEQTITFNPTDSNGTGFSTPLPPVTLTIKDNIVTPSMVFSQAWGDVHIVTYNGLLYNFQAAGEFTLAKTLIPNDSFDIQLRLVPSHGGAVSLINQVAMSLGTDRVTIDGSRAQPVWIDGAPSTLTADTPILSLAGGTVTELAPSIWKVEWNTGEEATVTSGGSFLNVTDGIPLSAPDQVAGLQGEDAGQDNDFQLSDGTVLQQPLSYSQLYGPFADSWRVTQDSSLFDYLPGQSTATFTDRGFPADFFDPTTVPAADAAKAAAVVAADGITDPGLAQAAMLDYLVTNDPAFVAAAAAVQKDNSSTTPFAPTAPPAPLIGVGVAPDVPGQVQSSNGPTPVVFDLSMTGTFTTDTVVNYTVVDGGAGFLGASAFGGTLPTGSVTIPAGTTTGSFTIDVPAGALATLSAANVEVSISSAVPVFSPLAQSSIANNVPEPGAPVVPIFTDLTTPTNLTLGASQTYTLDLGTFAEGQVVAPEQLELVNGAAAPADSLSGNFTAPIGSGFIVIGGGLPTALTPGQIYNGIFITPLTNQPGSRTETLTFVPRDVNASGFSATQPTITLVLKENVTAAALADINTPTTIVFPNAHVGTVEQEVVSISNMAVAPAGSLDVTPSALGVATVSGAVTGLAPGGTDATSITAGLDTSAAGHLGGIVALTASSVSSGGSPVPLSGSPSVNIFGAVYRMAAATIAPVTTILHVGDGGVVALGVQNSAAKDGFSESLIASLGTTTGAVAAGASTPTADIAAGATDTSSLTVSVATSSAGVQSGTATVNLTSDGGVGADSLDGLGQTTMTAQSVPVSVTVNNFAQAAITSTGPALTAGPTAGTFVLDLGSIQTGATVTPVSLSAINAATGPADQLNGSFSISNSGPFINSGFAGFTDLAAGTSAAAGSVSLDTSTTGTFSETITLTPTDVNTSGFSLVQSPQVVTVTGTVTPAVVQPPDAAAITVNTSSPIVFPNVIVDTPESQTVSITNSATLPADALAVTPSASGDALASGAITGLAAGAPADTTDISVGLDTSVAGTRSGVVALAASSVVGDLTVPLASSPSLSVSGNVFRRAAATIAPLTAILHIGDSGLLPLAVGNTAASDGFSESLIAAIASTMGSVTAGSGGPTGDIAAGANDASLAVSVSTATAGVQSGTATVSLTSDGGSGAGSIDGLGTAGLTSQVVPVSVTVDNFAVAAMTSASPTLKAGQTPNSFILDLGTITAGTLVAPISLNALNAATGVADLLDGSYSISNDGPFINTGFGGFKGLAAGASTGAGTVTLDTSQAGTFSETITLTPTDENSSGFSQTQTAQTVTVTATVTPIGTATGDVHMLTFDGLTYDFQALGDFTLTQSTVAGNPFAVQIRTSSDPVDHLASVNTEVAAQVGDNSIRFDLGGSLTINGVTETATAGRQLLGGGSLEVVTPDLYLVGWTNGEKLVVINQGQYFDVTMKLAPTDGAGSVRGLMGSNSGQANDFQLPDGTVLAPPVSDSELLGAFADGWRISGPSQSMLSGGSSDAAALLAPSQLGLSHSMNFITADEAGEVLTGSLVVSAAGGAPVTASGTASMLAGDTLSQFGAGDRLDITDFASTGATVSFARTGLGGDITVANGLQRVVLHEVGAVPGGALALVSDRHGGSLIGWG